MRLIVLCAAVLLPALAAAADIGVVGLFPNKAVLVINGAAPKTYTVGDSLGEGYKLVAATQTNATVEVNGKRQTVSIGEHVARSAPGARPSVTLQADSRGHYTTTGQINGGPMRLIVDTGASNIALPAADAVRLGIDYKKGQMGYTSTANGVTPVYVIKLDRVRVGDIELNQVDATVHESGLPIGLLGMSFLNRTEMRQEGGQMTLTKRY